MTETNHNQSLDKNSLLNAYADAIKHSPQQEMEELLAELPENGWRFDNSDFLAEGGAKQVFTSHDRLTGRTLARAFPKEGANTEAFLREARLNALLEHPNILPVYDIALDEENPYFSMKLIKGETLASLVSKLAAAELEKPEVQNRLLDIYLKVCDAIAYAHSKGVLHLDLKPENIHVSTYGEVLVGDWGLAKIIDEECEDYILQDIAVVSTEITNPTRMGFLKGTPGFMAPEQCCADGVKNKSTDIYSLGALLYFMLCGQKPIDDKDQNEIIDKTTRGDINWNSMDKIPAGIEAVIRKAMATDQQLRYDSTQTLINDINAFRAGFLTSAEPTSFYKQLEKLYRRHRSISLSIIFSLAIIFTLVIFFVSNLHESETRTREALNSYLAEKAEKERVRLDLAQRYLEKAQNLYQDSVPEGTNYLPHLNTQAYANVVRALELNPSLKKGWALKGRLSIFLGKYGEAVESFSHAGEKKARYGNLVKQFISKRSSQSTKLPVSEMIDLLYALKPTKDTRLLNDLTFKTIFSDLTIKERIWFVREALKFHHGFKAISFSFDESRMAMNLSANKALWIIYPLKNIQLRELNLSDTSVSKDFMHIEKMPLRVLKAANIPISDYHLTYLANKPIRELDLRNCRVKNLEILKSLKLEILDISGTNCRDFSFLASCPLLKTITISQNQAESVRKQVKNRDVKIIVR